MPCIRVICKIVKLFDDSILGVISGVCPEASSAPPISIVLKNRRREVGFVFIVILIIYGPTRPIIEH